MNNEQEVNDMQPFIESTIKELENRARQPFMAVWHCASMEELRKVMKQCQDAKQSYIKGLAGSSDLVRKILVGWIEVCDMEIREGEAVFYSLR